jgi:sec-independent protein translocase protein TatB
MLSIPHMIVVFIIVLVVFGPQKLPELARGLGKLMAEFRKASTDFKSAFEEEMRDLDRQAREVERKKQALLASAAAEPAQPATLATPSGVETQEPIPELASANGESRATEAGELVAVTVPESVARGVETPEQIADGAANVASTVDSNLVSNVDPNEPPNGAGNVAQKADSTSAIGPDAPAETHLDPTHDRQ